MSSPNEPTDDDATSSGDGLDDASPFLQRRADDPESGVTATGPTFEFGPGPAATEPPSPQPPAPQPPSPPGPPSADSWQSGISPPQSPAPQPPAQQPPAQQPPAPPSADTWQAPQLPSQLPPSPTPGSWDALSPPQARFELGADTSTRSGWHGVHPVLLAVAGIGFAITILLALAVALVERNDNDTAYLLGYALGGPIVILLVTLAVWKLASPKAGAITLIVVAALSSLGSLGQFGTAARENRETTQAVEQALEDVGIDPTNASFSTTRSEEQCLGGQGIDSDALLNALTDTSLTGADTQARILDALLICAPRIIDDPSWIEQQRSSFSAGIGFEITTPEVKCLFRYAVDNSDSPGLAMSSQLDVDFLLAAMDECLSEESMALLRGDVGTGPQVYGDDADFDLLFDRCVGGSSSGCDVLFGSASTGSEYAVLSEDCAGRGLQSESYCTPGIIDDGAGFADGSSPGLADLETACQSGDMIACDFAFEISPFGSEVERVGETCGGRVPFLTSTCRAQFGAQADE